MTLGAVLTAFFGITLITGIAPLNISSRVGLLEAGGQVA
jgi:hypothetical protein